MPRSDFESWLMPQSPFTLMGWLVVQLLPPNAQDLQAASPREPSRRPSTLTSNDDDALPMVRSLSFGSEHKCLICMRSDHLI